MNKKLRAKLAKVATIELFAREEHARIEGNASAIDPKTDKEIAEWIRRELDSGNEWAWCTAEVRASFGGLSASAYLGCCSYKSEADFKQEDGYYPQMVIEALDDLAGVLTSMKKTLQELEG